MTTPEETHQPDDDDVVIWYVEERNGLDVYRVTKGPTVIGEYTGRSHGRNRSIPHHETVAT
jgi:hypothetical protein